MNFSKSFKKPYLGFKTPAVMGILNITPDSFYDGNKNFTSNAINQSLKKLLKCDIIYIEEVRLQLGNPLLYKLAHRSVAP